MDYLGKKYKLTKSENFDEFMKKLGVNFFLRKTAAATTPVLSLVKNNDDTYTLVTATTIKTIKLVFKLDEEFDEERADGAKVKSILSLDGNILKHIQRNTEGNITRIIRKFGPTEMEATSTIDGCDVKCHRIYELIET